jgi:hypothetical protein
MVYHGQFFRGSKYHMTPVIITITMNTGFCEPLDFKFRRNADGTQLSQKTHTFEVRGDCSFVDIGEIVDHHCLNFRNLVMN